MNKEYIYTGGLSNYLVSMAVKEVIFYLHNLYPDCLEISDLIHHKFPINYTSMVANSLDEVKKFRGKYEH